MSNKPIIPLDEELDQFQAYAMAWSRECLPQAVLDDPDERAMRVGEEFIALLQTSGMSRSVLHRLVDHTFDRSPKGPSQKLGSTMIALSLWAAQRGLSLTGAANMELMSAWGNVPEIRSKQAGKLTMAEANTAAVEWSLDNTQRAAVMLLQGNNEQKKQAFAYLLDHQDKLYAQAVSDVER